MPLSKAAQETLAKAKALKATQERAAKTKGSTAKTGKASAQQLALGLKTISDPTPNPLDDAPPLTGDESVDMLNELDAIDHAVADPTGYIARAKAEDKRNADATESGFYFTVGFLCDADKDRFLERAGLVPADVYGDMFLDGYQVADRLGVDMT